jgi:hypothetical protein
VANCLHTPLLRTLRNPDRLVSQFGRQGNRTGEPETCGMMQPARGVIACVNTELYQVEERPSGTGMVLVHALTGFVDAGQAGHLAVAHLLGNLEGPARFPLRT